MCGLARGLSKLLISWEIELRKKLYAEFENGGGWGNGEVGGFGAGFGDTAGVGFSDLRSGVGFFGPI